MESFPFPLCWINSNIWIGFNHYTNIQIYRFLNACLYFKRWIYTMKQTDLCTFAFRREWTKEKKFCNCRNFIETEILRHDTFTLKAPPLIRSKDVFTSRSKWQSNDHFLLFSKIIKIRVLLKASKKNWSSLPWGSLPSNDLPLCYIMFECTFLVTVEKFKLNQVKF